MDRPTKYSGGREITFRRAESAAFFGREIGLQYVHAHLRYAEALAAMGRADELLQAMLVVNPIAVTDVVKLAQPRQRNCYFSSSDAQFRDRYEASRDYDKLRKGQVATDGGWRIYSSGPGIYTNLVIRHLFGLRRHFDSMEFDPVLPRKFDGATIDRIEDGRAIQYRFGVKSGVCSPKSIKVNGKSMPLVPIQHPYRAGGVRVALASFLEALTPAVNIVEINL